MKRITLTQGKHAIVDDIDFKRVSRFRWFAWWNGWTFYAVRNVVKDGKKTTQYMHRFIMRARRGREIDHRKGNGLDNRRSMLRSCTRSVNGQNRPRLNKNNTTGHAGVNWHKNGKKWQASLMRNGKSIHLGLFSRKSDAIKVRNKALTL